MVWAGLHGRFTGVSPVLAAPDRRGDRCRVSRGAMWTSRRVFGGSPDTFKLQLEYGSPSVELPSELRFLNTLDYPQLALLPSGPSQVRLPVVAASLEFEFNSDEGEAGIAERFAARKAALLGERAEERVQVRLLPRPGNAGSSTGLHGTGHGTSGGLPTAISSSTTTIWANHQSPAVPVPSTHGSQAAAAEEAWGLDLQLSVVVRVPVVRCITLTRTSSSGSPSDTVLVNLINQFDLSTVWKLKSTEGFGNWWCTAAAARDWTNLRNMNMSHCGLTTLPAAIGELVALRILRLSHNKLAALPSEVQALTSLEVLAVDHNLLTAIPAELRRCSALRELNLEGNKLTTPVLDLRALYNLQSLQLFGNPLEYLPELSPCTQLRSLSLANVRIMADAVFTRWEVEVGALPYMARGHKLSTLFKLTFRRASLQHPLLAGALGRIAEDRTNCELIAKEEAAIQQLVLMALSENQVVVKQACKTIGHLAEYSPATAKQLIAHDVLSAVATLMKAQGQDSQLCGLNVLSSLGAGSDSVSAQLLTPGILSRLHSLILKGDPSVRQAALFSLSNLCFCRDNKSLVRKADGLIRLLVELAQPHPAQGTSDLSRLMAVRVLAVLGENEAVRLALGQPPIHRGRGLRILCMDGGGMRGLVTVQILRHLEQRLGCPISSAFDMIVGTSTGAILAVALGMLRYNLDMCENIYTKLGHKVFNNQASANRESEMVSWTESLYRMYKSGSQNIRAATAVVFASTKHDASTFESLLKDMCNLVKLGCVSDQCIDAALLGGPKVLVVATLAGVTPAVPYVFRSYELPLEAERRAAKIGGWAGSSKHLVWQAVRASSAAPYYLDEFNCGEERFQDGAATANNPTLVAIQQAQLLWPDTPLEVVVSLGSGLSVSKPRERGMHAYLDTGNLLIESATSTERVHEAAATLLALVPGVRYFRFQPVDDRCTIELDDIDPTHWTQLKVATEEFCIAHTARFDEAASALLASEHGAEDGAASRDGQTVKASALTSPRVPALRLGFRRGLLLLEAPRAGQLPGARSLTDRIAEAISRLPELTRRADVGAAAGRLHDSQQCLGNNSSLGGAAGGAGGDLLVGRSGSISAGQGRGETQGRGAHGSQAGVGTAGPPDSAPPVGGVGSGVGQAWPLTGFGSYIADPNPGQPNRARQGQGKPRPDAPLPPVASSSAITERRVTSEGGLDAPGWQPSSSVPTLSHPAPHHGVTAGRSYAKAAAAAMAAAEAAAAHGGLHGAFLPAHVSRTAPSSVGSGDSHLPLAAASSSLPAPSAGVSGAVAAARALPQVAGSGSTTFVMPRAASAQATQQQQQQAAAAQQERPGVAMQPPHLQSPMSQESGDPHNTSNSGATAAGGSAPVAVPTASTAASGAGAVSVTSPTSSTSTFLNYFIPTSWTATATPPATATAGGATAQQPATTAPPRKSDGGPLTPRADGAEAALALGRSSAPGGAGVVAGDASGGAGGESGTASRAASGLSGMLSPTAVAAAAASAAAAAAADGAGAQAGMLPPTFQDMPHREDEGSGMVVAAREVADEAGVGGVAGASDGACSSGPSSGGGAAGPILSPPRGRGGPLDGALARAEVVRRISTSHAAFTAGEAGDLITAGEEAGAGGRLAEAGGLVASAAGAVLAGAGGSGAMHGLAPHELIRALLQDLGDSLGVVHLALHTASTRPEQQQQQQHPHQYQCQHGQHEQQGQGERDRASVGTNQQPGTEGQASAHVSDSRGARAGEGGGAVEDGLVLQWQQEVLAVVEPGPEASRIVHELGHDPSATSLSRLCAAQPSQTCFRAGDTQLLKLAHQQVTTARGAQVGSYLFQRTSPQSLLLPEHVLAMASDWSGLLVVSGTPLPYPITEALLRAGVKAVVAPAEEAWWALASGLASVGSGASTSGAPGPSHGGAGQATGQAHGLGLGGGLVRSSSVSSLAGQQGPCGGDIHGLGYAHGHSHAAQTTGGAGAGAGGSGFDAGASSAPLGPQALEVEVVRFMCAFYKALFAGDAVLASIEAGEGAAPHLAGLFVCFHL